MTVWVRDGENLRLYSVLKGCIATVSRCGNLWRANVWGPRGSSSHCYDWSGDAKYWAENYWKTEVWRRE